MGDRLVTTKLIVFAYLLIGVVQAAASFYSFFTVMYDYGIHPSGLMFLNSAKIQKFNSLSSVEKTEVDWLDNDDGRLHICGRWANVDVSASTWQQFDAAAMS